MQTFPQSLIKLRLPCLNEYRPIPCKPSWLNKSNLKPILEWTNGKLDLQELMQNFSSALLNNYNIFLLASLSCSLPKIKETFLAWNKSKQPLARSNGNLALLELKETYFLANFRLLELMETFPCLNQ